MRMVITNLPADTLYYVQLRTKTGDRASAWSQAFELRTAKDEVPPQPVTDLSGVMSEGNLSLAWTPPTHNADGTELYDLKDYKVSIGPVPADPNWPVFTMYVEGNRASFTKEMNTAAFGTYRASLTINVQARDLVDNLSADAVITKIKAAPVAPTGLTWAAVGNSFSASWTPPTTNVDGSAFTDPDGFEVKVIYNGTNVRTYNTNVPKFDYSYEQNKADFGGVQQTARGTLTIEVRARDSVGQLSTAATATASNPVPAAPTGLTATVLQSAISLKWNKNTEDDFANYQVWQGATSSDTGTLVAEPLTNAYLHETVAYGTDHYFYVKAVDVMGGASPASTRTGALRPISPFQVDTTPPNAPTAVASTWVANTADPSGASGDIRVTWTASTSTDVRNYVVAYSTDNTNWSYMNSDGSPATIKNQRAGSTYYIKVKAVDADANSSTYVIASNLVTAIDSTAPAAVTGVSASGGLQTLTVFWTENTEIDVKNGAGTYEVQVDTANTFATGNLKTVKTSGTVVGFSNLITNTTYYARVRAIDSSGNAGPYSSIVSAAVGNATTNLSDGAAPSSSPTPIVNPLYQALEIKWAAVTNADPVTYEVHVSTSSGFTPAAGTKAGEVSGTSFIVKTLPGTSTALTYGTTYYVRLIAKDRDGAAAAGTQGSGVPSQVDNGDIAANAVRANQIQAGVITADKLTISVGGDNLWSNSSFEDPTNYFAGWSIYSNDGVSSSSKVTGRRAGTFAARVSWTTASVQTQGLHRGLPGGWKAGQWYSLSFWARAGGVPVGRVFTNHHNTHPTTYTWVQNPALTANWQRYVTRFQYSADTTDPTFWGVGNTAAGTNWIEFDDVKVEEGEIATNYSPKSDEILPGSIVGTQIADGEIKTAHMLANTITGDRIQTNTLNADRIVSLSITAEKIQGGTITGDKINVNDLFSKNATVSGSLTMGATDGGAGAVQSFDYDPATSKGWRIDANGITIYEGTVNASALNIGSIQAGLTSIDGSIIKTGSIRSNAFSPVGDTTQPAWALDTAGNMQINDGLVRGRLVVGSANNTGVQISSSNYGGTGAQWAIKGDGTIDLKGGTVSGGVAGASSLQVSSTGIVAKDSGGNTRVNITNSGTFSLATTNGGVIFDDNGLRLYNGATPVVDLNRNGSASFTGTVTASGGSIANWTISTNTLSKNGITLDSSTGAIYTGSGTSTVGLRGNYGLWAGSTNPWDSGVPFYVDTTGYLTSKRGYIGGWTINATTLSGSGTISGGTITGTFITGVTITGSTVQTSDSWPRVVMDTSNTIKFYNSGGSYVGALAGTNSNGSAWVSLNGADGGVAQIGARNGTTYLGYPETFNYPSSSTYLQGAYVYIQSPYQGRTSFNNRPYIDGIGYVENQGHSHSEYSHSHPYASSTHYHGDNGGQNFYNANNVGYTNKLYRSDSSTSWYIQSVSQTGIYIGDNNAYRGFSVGTVTPGNTKNFVIDHPTSEKKDTHYLVHTCLEGPTADVYYRGRGQLKPDGGWEPGDQAERVSRVTIKLPDYFEDIAELEGRTVQVTPIVGACKNDPDNPCNNFLAPALGASEVRNGEFKVYEMAGYSHPCCQFYWEVKAIRKDVKQPEVEPKKADYELHGDGPYTYLRKK